MNNIVTSVPQAVKLLKDEGVKPGSSPEAVQAALAKKQRLIALPLLQRALAELEAEPATPDPAAPAEPATPEPAAPADSAAPEPAAPAEPDVDR